MAALLREGAEQGLWQLRPLVQVPPGPGPQATPKREIAEKCRAVGQRRRHRTGDPFDLGR